MNDYARRVLNKLNEDRVWNKAFCDFTIIIKGREFPVHKCMLAVTSEFFKRMFATNMKEKYQNFIEFETGIRQEEMEIVLHFIYGNSKILTSDNIYEVLKAADFLQISDLIVFCKDYFKAHLSEENALTGREFALQLNMSDVLSDCNIFISKNFSKLSKQKKFFEIQPNEICEIFRLKDGTTSEEDFYNSIVNWVNYDLENRQAYFPKFFKLIKLDSLHKSFLSLTVSSNELVLGNPDCSKELVKAMRSHIQSVESASSQQSKPISRSDIPLAGRPKIQQFSFSNSAPVLVTDVTKSAGAAIAGSAASSASRAKILATASGIVPAKPDASSISPAVFLPKTQATKLIFVGGVTSPTYLRIYDVCSKWWSKPTTEEFGSYIDASVVTLNKTVYIIGGRESNSDNSVTDLDVLDMKQSNSPKWSQRTGMNQKRHTFACVVHGKKIYVAGGRAHQSERLSSVEIYVIGADAWLSAPSMNIRREGCALVVRAGNLHVLGGSCDSKTCLNSMEILSSNCWSFSVCMNQERSNFSAVVWNNMIYAIGGQNSKGKFLKSVEKFDGQKWCFISSLLQPQAGHSACILGNKIYVSGGKNHEGAVNVMQVYDLLANSWHLDCQIKGDPRGLAMAVI